MDTNFRGGKIKTFVWDMPKTIKLNWERRPWQLKQYV
jgi:hypothetical protein